MLVSDLKEEGLIVGNIAKFWIDAIRTVRAKLMVTCQDPEHQKVDVIITEVKNSKYECQYRPIKCGLHIISITYGSLNVRKEPFQVSRIVKIFPSNSTCTEF